MLFGISAPRGYNSWFAEKPKDASMSRFPLFDRDQIRLRALSERGHDLRAQDCLELDVELANYANPEFETLVQAIVQARQAGRPVILMMGAHPIKLGLSRFLIDLIDRGLVTLLATNGAGMIHDYELALGDGTSEDVPKWIQQGQFGLWNETSRLNDIIVAAARRQEGLGEAVGRTIEQNEFPRRDLSIAAAGWRAGVPITSHVSVGSDIIHSHPNCDGAALGAASYTDFLIFARAIQDLAGGVFLNVGSAVTGPEVYLKALSMARNVARQQGQEIRSFTTAVFDLADLPADYRAGPPGKDHPMYYYRPWKTILVRTVADGGRSFYFSGDHRITIPSLWRRVTRAAESDRQDTSAA
jgi:deoxyhypusine synthase